MSDSKTAAADGVVKELEDGRYALRFERYLAHPVERVWAALTEPEELAGWLAEADVELVEGGSIVLRWQNVITPEQVAKYDIKGLEEADLEQQRPVTGTITRIDPPRLLEYDTDRFGLLRWELQEHDGGCLLSFASTMAVPEEMLTQVLAGWHQHLDALENLLAGHRADWPNWPIERWAEHRERYAAKLG